jgi:sugar/nucleoside kinase (ribokinase family)
MSEAYAALGHVVVDVITAPDKSVRVERLGGAGLHAALGLRLAVPGGVLPCSGVGSDLVSGNRAFFNAWQLDPQALRTRSAQTPRTAVEYHDRGRDEESLLGDDHFAAHRPALADLGGLAATLNGLYTFQEADSPEWAGLAALRCPVAWELSLVDCRDAGGWERVRRRLADVEIVSLNTDEGRTLTGLADPATLLQTLLRPGVDVAILRAGEDGSYVAGSEGKFHVAAAPADRIVDPTGAGNAYSGAFLGAWARGASLVEASKRAAAAASFIVEQYGPPDAPPDENEIARRSAMTTVEPLRVSAEVRA